MVEDQVDETPGETEGKESQIEQGRRRVTDGHCWSGGKGWTDADGCTLSKHAGLLRQG